MNEIVSMEMHCLYFLKFYLRELNCIVSSIKSLLAITENGGSRSVRWMQRFVASSRCYWASNIRRFRTKKGIYQLGRPPLLDTMTRRFMGAA